jgi:hypothetical protein
MYAAKIIQPPTNNKIRYGLLANVFTPVAMESESSCGKAGLREGE